MKISKAKLLGICFFGMGLFAGMDGLAIPVGGLGDITVFTAVLFITVGIGIVSNHLKSSKLSTSLILYYIVLFISSFVNLIILPSSWGKANLRYWIVNGIGVLGFYFVFSHNERNKYFIEFKKGLLANCLIQSGWAIMQFTLLRVANVSLNSLLGIKGANIHKGVLKTVTGIGWERASLCFVLAIGYLLLEKKWQKIMCVVATILTFSRTGYLLMLIIVILSIDYRNIGNVFIVNKRKIVIGLIEITVVLTILIVFRDVIISTFLTTMNRFDNLSEEASGYTHMNYYIRFFDVLKSQNLLNTLVGYGPSASGFPYTYYWGSKTALGSWTVESLWLSVFFSSGVIGTVCYITWYLDCILKAKKCKLKVYNILLALVVCGFMYKFMWSYQFIVVIMLLSENPVKSEIG